MRKWTKVAYSHSVKKPEIHFHLNDISFLLKNVTFTIFVEKVLK